MGNDKSDGMKVCDWCHGKSRNPAKINGEYVCMDCMKNLRRDKCRVCGQSLGAHPIRGICISCIQLGHFEATKAEEEIAAGLGPMDVGGQENEEKGMSEEDYNHFLTFGGGMFKPIKKKESKKDWVLKRFKKDHIWNQDNIGEHARDIDKLISRHEGELEDESMHIIRAEDILQFMGAKVLDKEGRVILVEV